MESHRTRLSLPEAIPEEFTLYCGWDKELAAALARRAAEPDSREWTPRDHTERFPDEAHAEAWYRSVSPRIIYSLFRASELAGVVWYSHAPRANLDANYTMAIRLYGPAKGRRLATPLLKAVEDDLEERSPIVVAGIWLETDHDNIAAQRTYLRAGYEEVSQEDTRVTMVKHIV